jgi:tetratricopeptide (TPR) repeat protein
VVAALAAVGVGALSCTEREVRIQFEKAEALRQAGKLTEAMDAYRAILALDETAEDAHNNLGFLQSKTGRPDSAAVHYRRAIALRPDFAEAHYNLGVAMAAMGRADSAEAAYLRALAIRPGYRDAANNLGVAYEATGRLESAADAYMKAAGIDSGFAEAHHNLGRVRFLQGRMEEAVRSYRRAIDLRPDFAEAVNDLGSAQAELGRLDDAQASFAHAVRLDTSFVLASDNLERLRQVREARAAGEMRVRHILVEKEDLARTLLDRLKQGDDFASLARTHSVDRAGSRGGDLGPFKPGDLMPEFEAAVKGLAPGQVGGPVKTAAGWHLIERIY